MLLDYVSVVVHVFKKDKREFYSLETLWGDAVLKKIKNIDEAMDQPKEEVRRVIDVNSDRLRTLIMEANRFEKPVEKLVEEPIIELKVAAKTKPTKLVKAKAVKESKVAKTKQSTETKVKKVAGKKASLKKVVKAKKSKPITKPALAKEKPQKVKATKVTVKKTKVVIKSSKSIKKK